MGAAGVAEVKWIWLLEIPEYSRPDGLRVRAQVVAYESWTECLRAIDFHQEMMPWFKCTQVEKA